MKKYIVTVDSVIIAVFVENRRSPEARTLANKLADKDFYLYGTRPYLYGTRPRVIETNEEVNLS
jgi:hypothetical protein